MLTKAANGVTFVDYEVLLPFLADNPDRTKLTTATQPSWFQPTWQRAFPDFEAYVFEGREEVPPAINLISKNPAVRGRVALQYMFTNGRSEFALVVTREGRTVWAEQNVAPHDVDAELRKALDMIRAPAADNPASTPHRWQRPSTTDAPPTFSAPPPIESRRPVPLTRTNVPGWWDEHWTSYEFTDLFIPGLATSSLRPPTIRLEFKADDRFEILVHDYSESPWRETWSTPARPIQVLVEFKSKPVLEQRVPRDKLRVRPALTLAIRKLREELATLAQQERTQPAVDGPPPDFDERRPHQMAPTPPVPPAEVDLAPAVPLTQKGIFGPFGAISDKLDPADDTGLGHTGLQFTYIAPSGQGPPVAMFRRTERALDPTEVEPSTEDRILVTWFGDRWQRKRFPNQPYNLKVYFANRLLAESDVASVAEAWRLVQKANTDLSTKRKRVDIADLKFKPLKLTLNQHLIELDPTTIAKIVAVIGTGSTYMFKYRNELYGVRKGRKPKVISVPYGDTKPAYIKALDAYIGLIKSEG